MAGEDPDYLSWVRKQPCACCGGPPPCHPHHSTRGPTESEWEGGRPNVQRYRGVSQKAHDHYTMPLHEKCHRQFHDGSGPFRDWTREQRRAWQREQVDIHRARYEEQEASGF